MRFIESPVGRMLIADEVGLGKTIEATYIWKEIQARQLARRLLIVCPAMLREKWRSALRKRFNITGQIILARDLFERIKDVAAH
jgi:SNF2 family DNA or RNA helicase